MMKPCLQAIVIGAVMTVAAPGPAGAQAAPASQLRGLSQAEADKVIGAVKTAQDQLRDGRNLYFQLLSGAPASYAQTLTSPRETFLSLDFDAPFSVENRSTGNRLWQPYRLELTGDRSLVWQVEVVLGFYDNLERVEIFARPPHPF